MAKGNELGFGSVRRELMLSSTLKSERAGDHWPLRTSMHIAPVCEGVGYQPLVKWNQVTRTGAMFMWSARRG